MRKLSAVTSATHSPGLWQLLFEGYCFGHWRRSAVIASASFHLDAEITLSKTGLRCPRAWGSSFKDSLQCFHVLFMILLSLPEQLVDTSGRAHIGNLERQCAVDREVWSRYVSTRFGTTTTNTKAKRPKQENIAGGHGSRK